MNTSVQHVVDTAEVEKHIIHEKINQVTRHVEIPLLQIVKKTVEVPEVAPLQFPDKVVDIPVVAPRQISQLQDADNVVDVPVVLVVQAPLVQVMAKTVQTPQLLFLDKIVVIPGIQTVQGPQTSESLNGEISTFQLELRMDTMCADEQDVFTKVNADLEQVACETCVKDNIAMVAREFGDLSRTSGSMQDRQEKKK